MATRYSVSVHLRTRARVRAMLIASIVAWGILAAPSEVLAQSAKTLYTRAHAREAVLRKSSAPTVVSLRALVASYEDVVRRYPRTSYADNALWQAALVSEMAHERSRQSRDVVTTTRLLKWLIKEYPHSTLVKSARTKVAAVESPAVVAAREPATPAAAAPTAVVTRPAAGPTPNAAAPAAPAAAPAASAALPPAALTSASSVTLTSLALSNLPRGDRLTIDLSKESAYTVEDVPGSRQLRIWLAASLSRNAQDALTRLRGAHIQAAKATPRGAGT